MYKFAWMKPAFGRAAGLFGAWARLGMAVMVGAVALPGPQAHAQTEPEAPQRISCAAVSAATCTVAKSLKRGVNFGGMLEAPKEGQWGATVMPAYMDVAGAHFQTVRLPVRWSNHAAVTEDGLIDEVFARRVDFIVDTLLMKGLYVILDFHHHTQMVGSKLHTGEYAVEERLLEKRFLNMWRQIEGRYRYRSPKLIFEILNEPYGKQTPARWNALAAKVVSIIRVHNPQRTVIVGVPYIGLSAAYDELVMPNDPHLIMGAHSYDPFDFTHQWVPNAVTCCSPDQRAQMVANLDKMAAWSVRTGYPVHLGEFGAIENAPLDARAAYARIMRDGAEARGMGWAYWDFVTTFAVYPKAANNWLEPIRAALLD